MKLGLIGDLHGLPQYHILQTTKFDYTIQVGDLGFDYSYLKDVDSEKHKFIRGNHDDPEKAQLSPHYLGNYGVYDLPGFERIFFLSGGWSIDWRERQNLMRRNPSKTVWWENEELSQVELDEALELYKREKPKFVIAHECPLFLVDLVGTKGFPANFGYPDIIETRTNRTLQAMVDYHEPENFVFGHYHKSFNRKIGNTNYVCLNCNEVKVYDF